MLAFVGYKPTFIKMKQSDLIDLVIYSLHYAGMA